MTDSKARIDPRYDPRFQRGYVGSEADAPPHADSPPPGSPVVAPVPVTREPREQVESRPARLEPEVSPVREPRVADRGTPRARVPHAPAPGAGASDGKAPAEPATDASTDPSTADPFAAAFSGVEPDDPESAVRARAWLIAGWLFSGAILAGGLWWSWSAAIDPRYYNGFGGANSNAFMFLQWSVPPAMVMIGAIGIVVVTTVAGLHQLAASADRDAGGRASAFPRVPAAYGLIAIAIVGAIATFWLGGLIADGQGVMWTESGPRADQLTTVALGRVGEVGIGPIAAAAFASVIGLVLLGVQSARPLRPTRRAG
ncbi:hypothetical protein LQ757_14915 [Agromyces sp. SYSU K20354]|uniref:hypothetical protein n=1 Tax=Agromyces cavernae TaxID=2898659 RepID=UPI001E3F5A8D|nr:hypothetical protein [Agromyces cavernae]MCD2443568.1 hypothetical protein [Agromyces cavernae]